MNHLAHLYLAGDDEERIVGQILGDFLEPGWRQRASAGVIAAVAEHQSIDVFTDEHPVVVRGRRRLDPPLRRFGGILLDVFFDHFLACRWREFSPDTPLEEFTGSRYAVLSRRREWLTMRLARALPAMARDDWLASSRTIEGVEATLARIAAMLSRPTPLPMGAELLRRERANWEADFDAFFPELLDRFGERRQPNR